MSLPLDHARHIHTVLANENQRYFNKLFTILYNKHSTLRGSRVVPHPSTRRAHCGLISQVGKGCDAFHKVWPNATEENITKTDQDYDNLTSKQNAI